MALSSKLDEIFSPVIVGLPRGRGADRDRVQTALRLGYDEVDVQQRATAIMFRLRIEVPQLAEEDEVVV